MIRKIISSTNKCILEKGMRRSILVLQSFNFCVKFSLLLLDLQKLGAGVAILSDRREDFQKRDLGM